MREGLKKREAEGKVFGFDETKVESAEEKIKEAVESIEGAVPIVEKK